MKNYTWLTFYFYWIDCRKARCKLSKRQGWVWCGNTAGAPALCGSDRPSCTRRPGTKRAEHRAEGNSETMTTSSTFKKACERQRQDQAAAGLPTVVPFPGSASCLGHKLWDEKVICSREEGMGERPSTEPFLPRVLHAVTAAWSPSCNGLFPVTGRVDGWQSLQMQAQVLRPTFCVCLHLQIK